MFAKMYLEITNVCNLQCSFCPGTRRRKRFLSREEFRLLASRLRPHGRYLYFHLMGEPLLHPELEAFLEIARELEFRVVLTTNGTLLPKRQEILLAAPALHKVNISLHAPEANGDAVDFAAYLDGCTEFARQAIEKGILCSLRLWNLDGARTVGERQRNDEVLSALHRAFPNEWTPNTRGMRLKDRLFLEWGEKFEWPELGRREFPEHGFCYGLRDQIGVLCDGTVVPCCLDHEGDIPLGNLFDSQLQTILDSAQARGLYDGFSARKMTHPLCRSCGYAQRFQKG